MEEIRKYVLQQRDLVIETRRELHRIPELANQEKKTSAYVATYLANEGLEVQTGIAGYGVVGTLTCEKPGPAMMIRADMDALPFKEETGLPFSSIHDGVMHACGHDAHMAMALAAATVLNKMKASLKGCVKFVFQPAEEGPGGAKRMIDAGILDHPRVDFSVGCHLWADIPEKTIGVRAGPFMAAMDRFDIRIIGKGGHAAMPHLCIDALEIGTQVINGLQRIVSRHMNPLKPSVVTIGSFTAGKAFNVIPGEAEMSGTTRTFDLTIWDTWESRIETIVRGICESMGAAYELKFAKGYPPTINDESVSQIVRSCAEKVVGEERVLVPDPTMGGEDMSFFLQKTKGCFYALGIGREGFSGIHHPKFDFNEDVMPLGVETHCRVAFALLGC